VETQSEAVRLPIVAVKSTEPSAPMMLARPIDLSRACMLLGAAEKVRPRRRATEINADIHRYQGFTAQGKFSITEV
jgi:hypothetical protein